MWRLLWCSLFSVLLCTSSVQAQDGATDTEKEGDSGIALSEKVGLVLRFPIAGLIVPMNKGQDRRREVKALVTQGVCPTFTYKVQNREVLGAGPCIYIAGMEKEDIDMYVGVMGSMFRHVSLACVLNVEDESLNWLCGINWPV